MDDIEDLRDGLWTLYRKATDARRHEIAYHVLAALVHAGEALKDAGLLDEVERTAHEHLSWLDAHEPRHTHATIAADSRGNVSVFKQLGVTAAAARARIKADAVQQKRRP